MASEWERLRGEAVDLMLDHRKHALSDQRDLISKEKHDRAEWHANLADTALRLAVAIEALKETP